MFDSHFHQTDPRSVGFASCGIEIGANYEELKEVFNFASKHENIYCTAGVHPAYARDYSMNDFENFVASNIDNPKFVAIGECGMDYHRNDLPTKEKQIEVFTHQIEMAYKYNKPLVIHSRDAAEDTIAVLEANKDKLVNGVLFHCMSYTAEVTLDLLKRLQGAQIYFAFGGHITYKDKTFLHETMKVISLDKILIETDAPYLSPVPKRGEINNPEFIKYTALKMAEVLNLTFDEIEKITTDNAYKFMKIKKAPM